MSSKNQKIDKEKQVIEKMITIYCKGHHQKQVCHECKQLLEYASSRIDHCPKMATKTFCSQCKIHCYKPDMQEKIKIVMRYSGPRMLYYHPIMAIKHIFIKGRNK